MVTAIVTILGLILATFVVVLFMTAFLWVCHEIGKGW